MSDPILKTRPTNQAEKTLRTRFADHVADQSDRMDKLAQQLITLELAVPALYATAVKLVHGEKATVAADGWLIGAFVVWSVALALTLASLIPRGWKVDPTLLEEDITGEAQPSGAMSIGAYFHRSAVYKRRFLLPAIGLFWLGTILAVVTVFR